MRKKPALLATLAVVLLGAAGATSVFLVGSKQRRDDRAAYLAYERATREPIARVREVGQELRTDAGGADVVARWTTALARARAAFGELKPPAFMPDASTRWIATVDAYAEVAVRHEKRPPDVALLDLLQRADDMFDHASDLMSLHRSRLGLRSALA